MNNNKVKSDKEAAFKEEVWVRDSDLSGKINEQLAKRGTWLSILFLAYGSLGVVYGDIGTSVLYVFPSIFSSMNLSKDEDDLKDDIYGAISLIFWTLTVLALVKYVGVVLKANDTGEGGTVALYALLCRTMGISPFGVMRMQDHKQVLAMKSAASGPVIRPNLSEHRHRFEKKPKPEQDKKKKKPEPKVPAKPSIFKKYTPPFGCAVLNGQIGITWFRKNIPMQRALLLLTLIATGLVIGDGILMPAFSVVSAISGLHQHTGDNINDGAIVGISVAIIVVLFCSQHLGTHKIAFLFSPIIIVWLLANLGIAIYNLSTYGGAVFQGLSPHWIVVFFNNHTRKGWEALGGVMLCVTGTETMFAAMGHFSRASIALAFGLLAYPCLMLTYLGQGAYLLSHPTNVQTTFWSSVPERLFWPMLVLATLAAIVASQAVITGTFSIIRQATSLGIFPKMRVVHTGDFVEGQIFIPVINYSLMVLCIAVVAGYEGDPIKLGNAYGVAVMMVMLITTLMTTMIMLMSWTVSVLLVIPFFVFFFTVEAVFLSANLFKVPAGGWFGLAVALAVTIIMWVWWKASYERRKLLLATSKATAAHDMFHVARTSTSGVRPALTEVGSAIDLTQLPVNAAGYAAGPYSRSESAKTDDMLKIPAPPIVPAPRPPMLSRFSASPGANANGGAAAGASGAANSRGLGSLSVGAANSTAEPNISTVSTSSDGVGSSRFEVVRSGGSTLGPAAREASALALQSKPDKLLASLGGVGLYYSDSPQGIPAVMRHFVRNIDAMHEVVIFLTVRFLPMPHIKNMERLLVRAVAGVPNFYQVVARYGYQDLVDHRNAFVSQVISTVMHKLELKAGLKYQGLEDDFIHELEGDEADDDEAGNQPAVTPFGLEAVQEVMIEEEEEKKELEQGSVGRSPYISKFARDAHDRIKLAASSPDAPQVAKDALAAANTLLSAAHEGIVYYLGRAWTRATPESNFLQHLMIDNIYRTMELLSYTDSEAWQIPLDNMVELGMTLEI